MKKLVLLCLFIWTAGSIFGQEISVVEKRAAEKVPFAQPFALQFVLSHTPGYQVTLDEDSLSSDFEITQVSSAENSPGTLTYDFTAIPFVLGKSTFTVTFDLTQEGKTVAQAKPREIAREQDTRPGNVIALSKIDALLDSGLWENQQYKLFYITLSDILREYLWRQFHVDASSDTTAELLRRVKTMPQMKPLMNQLREFLSSGDLVKFAKAVPSEQIRDKDVTLLRQIITETAPKELAPLASKEEA